MTVRIEQFAEHHRISLIEMILAIEQDEFDLPLSYGEQIDLHDIAATYCSGVGQFWVAQADGTPPDFVVGSLGLHDMGKDGAGRRVGGLHKMFVREDHRGGGADGVAARLLRTLEEHARRHGIAALFLGMPEKFRAGHRFYEKHGYRCIAAGDLPSAYVRQDVHTRFYAKTL